ncbi:1187_t:CDS:2, partial [Dentiscutata heterogama]
EEIDSGHRSVSCNCGTSWKRGRPSALERHILVECKTVEPHVKEAVRRMIETREKELTQSNRKRKANDDQQEINSYFESLALTEDIRKILYDADLYEETNAITFEQAIINVNINQSSIDDDNDIVSEESLELEEALDLSNLSFLPETGRQTDADMDDVLEAGSSDWLEEFNQEEDYDPAELGE